MLVEASESLANPPWDAIGAAAAGDSIAVSPLAG